jgi:hypothetical protein
MKAIILPAQIEGVATRSDKTLKVTIGTQELPPSDAGRLFGMNQRLCYIAIKEEAFEKDDVTLMEGLNVSSEDTKNRTPSQRLRGILFVLFKEDSKGHESFDSFYAQQMEKLIQHFKDKLDAIKLV